MGRARPGTRASPAGGPQPRGERPEPGPRPDASALPTPPFMALLQPRPKHGLRERRGREPPRAPPPSLGAGAEPPRVRTWGPPEHPAALHARPSAPRSPHPCPTQPPCSPHPFPIQIPSHPHTAPFPSPCSPHPYPIQSLSLPHVAPILSPCSSAFCPPRPHVPSHSVTLLTPCPPQAAGPLTAPGHGLHHSGAEARPRCCSGWGWGRVLGNHSPAPRLALGRGQRAPPPARGPCCHLAPGQGLGDLRLGSGDARPEERVCPREHHGRVSETKRPPPAPKCHPRQQGCCLSPQGLPREAVPRPGHQDLSPRAPWVQAAGLSGDVGAERGAGAGLGAGATRGRAGPGLRVGSQV